jgi:hypothetical protein
MSNGTVWRSYVGALLNSRSVSSEEVAILSQRSHLDTQMFTVIIIWTALSAYHNLPKRLVTMPYVENIL